MKVVHSDRKQKSQRVLRTGSRLQRTTRKFAGDRNKRSVS